MNPIELLDIISAGETSKVQFKREFDNKDKIAAEIIAFSNSKGGILLFGVEDKTGGIIGLEYQELQKTGNSIATIASDFIKPLVYVTTEVVQVNTDTGKKNILIVYVDGVIFISIDDDEVAQLRKICDEVFGEGNFAASVIWEKKFAIIPSCIPDRLG
jgi:hypothetical protein